MSLRFSPPHLIDLRVRAGMSRDDLARAIGLSYWAVTSWERGRSVPGGESLAAIANTLNCSIEDLFDEVASA